LLPYSDDQECQQHRVHDAYDSVEEASDVIVLLALFGGHKALHQLQPGDCGEANPDNHQNAKTYRDRRRAIPFRAGSRAAHILAAAILRREK
jgi:hypothetical protein